MHAHGAAARQLLGEQSGVVAEVFADASTAQIDDKLRALLVIAEKVRRDGRLVTDDDVQRAGCPDMPWLNEYQCCGRPWRRWLGALVCHSIAS